MGADEFQAARARVVEALRDPTATVGTTVRWDSMDRVAGNLAHDDPRLTPVWVDDLGRLWKERWIARADGAELICILDLREIQDSTGTVADASRFESSK